jgi:hypothetical protein
VNPSNSDLAQPHAPESQRGFPIGLLISLGVIVSMLLVAATILVLGWNSARSALINTAERTANDTSQLINARARVLLEPTQSTLRQVSFDPIVYAKTLQQRIDRLYVLSEVLTVNPMISAIYVGYDNGEFLLARPLDTASVRERFKAPGGANFMVQARTRQKNGKIVGEYIFFDANSVIEERRTIPEYQFDPRERPWYIGANVTTESVLSPPYVFFSTQQVGVTLSRLSRSGKSVVGIDMVLDDISTTLGTLKLSKNSELALINDKNEVLAYPEMDRVLLRGANGFTFKKVSEFDSPPLQRLQAADPPPGKVQFFDVAGVETLGIKLPFDIWAGSEMHLLVTAPVEDLLGDLPQKRNTLALGLVGRITHWPLSG